MTTERDLQTITCEHDGPILRVTLNRPKVLNAIDGRMLGEIHDTLAELCNALGNCDESIELTKKAIKEDHDKKYYAEQLERFKKIQAKQAGSP